MKWFSKRVLKEPPFNKYFFRPFLKTIDWKKLKYLTLSLIKIFYKKSKKILKPFKKYPLGQEGVKNRLDLV